MTTTAFDHTAPHEHPVPLRTPGSRLGPGEDFPEDLTRLGMAELQVLHSRITRQLDHDYLTDPAGPHAATMDRCQDLQDELNTRDTA
ncbi:hypothetical protein GCM10011374_34510 [Kocuria dechangensis]|uniref:Uncharacterized protein n=1 Tax=Kocuria dechangensis TaxID=1176249 RepID=A0A917H4I9_9MICC|nr:hypothetical protein [Kocuria dechangensis]GGG67364.1 hypothetical protein GCM10011374_34510 [Kocuria dechangensis]